MERTMFISTLKHTSTLKRMPVSCGMLLETVFRLNRLDFNGYFKYCKSKNTRANHPYKMQTKSAKVNSLKYSFFVKIIKDWNNQSTKPPLYWWNQTVQLFKYAKWGYFSITNESQQRRLGEPLGGSGVFSPKNILKSEKLWKAISSVLRGQFCLKCSLNHINWLPLFA